MKEILLTNDDGFESEGLRELAKMLKNEFNARVLIIAPANEKSACSHSITLTKPLNFVKIAEDFYKLDDGTPSDCIYLALEVFFKEKKPDLIISGINKGANVCEDITYSGTCAGAMEGALHKIPSLALSQIYEKKDEKFDFTRALEITKNLVAKIFEKGFMLREKEFLNVNFPSPKKAFKGLKICKAGKRIYSHHAFKNTNPRGLEYYWLAAADLAHEKDEQSDICSLLDGFATLTPIKLDLSAYESFERVQKWLEN